MSGILLTSGAQTFYHIVMSFPTVLFTVLLLVVLCYWLLAILGAVDISILDFEMDMDADASALSNVTAFMMRLGLHGVPVTIVISLIALIGWLICYYASYFFQGVFSVTFLRYLVGLPVFLGSLYAAVMLTALVIRPLRPLFKRVEQQTIKRVLGQVAIVRSTLVNNRAGEATLADGGAGLILKVRSRGEEEFHRGDRVVLLEYVPEQYFYRVISEQEFLGAPAA
jgi:hypothetical protein